MRSPHLYTRKLANLILSASFLTLTLEAASQPLDDFETRRLATKKCGPIAYPKSARSAGAFGTTSLLFTITPEGKVGRLTVLRWSGTTDQHRLLDQTSESHLAACTFVEQEGPESRHYKVNYVWRLNEDEPSVAP